MQVGLCSHKASKLGIVGISHVPPPLGEPLHAAPQLQHMSQTTMNYMQCVRWSIRAQSDGSKSAQEHTARPGHGEPSASSVKHRPPEMLLADAKQGDRCPRSIAPAPRCHCAHAAWDENVCISQSRRICHKLKHLPGGTRQQRSSIFSPPYDNGRHSTEGGTSLVACSLANRLCERAGQEQRLDGAVQRRTDPERFLQAPHVQELLSHSQRIRTTLAPSTASYIRQVKNGIGEGLDECHIPHSDMEL